MTMQYPVHPDDERLAALAGNDPEATGDAPLAEHVAGCRRCGGVVDELRTLRASLAELPDLRPGRPIQLLPPVPAAGAADGGPFGWLRRLAAPAMVTGAGLALVGAVGFGGTVFGGMAASGGAAPDTMLDGRGDAENYESATQVPAAADPSGAGAPNEGVNEADREDGNRDFALPAVDLASPTPWLMLAGTGLALLLLGLVLRHAIRPRAG
jgi:hypothetical protein